MICVLIKSNLRRALCWEVQVRAVECPDQSQNNTSKIAVFWLAESNGAVYTHEAGGFSDSHGEADADSLASDKER